MDIQVVSSGIFIPGFGPCLADPCERGKVSATPGMTRQQAEELTVSAQKYLRMIHFNKIHIGKGSYFTCIEKRSDLDNR